MKNKSIFFCVIIVFLLLNITLASAFDFLETAKDTWSKIEPNEKNINALASVLKGPLGFDGGNILLYFFIGLIAGLYGWIYRITILKIYWKIIEHTPYKSPFSTKKGVWLNKISGKIWKAFLIGAIYAVAMQIPIINVALQYLTLDKFINSIFTRAFILFIELVFLPSIIESYWKTSTEMKYEKMLTGARRLGAMARAEASAP